MGKIFPDKPNVIHYKLESILIQRLAICIIFLFLYFYFPKVKPIYYFLDVKGIGSPSSPGPIFSFLSEIIEILVGILRALLVFILPPVLSVLFAWKTIRKINSYVRKKYEYLRLKSSDHVEKKTPENIFIKDTYKAHVDLKQFSERGKESYAAGNYKEAISIYSEAINLCSNHAAYYNRGILYYKIGKKKKAVTDFKQAAKLGHEKAQKILTSRKIAW